MKKKGQFLGMPVVFFGLLVAILLVVLGLFIFYTGFLDKAVVWIRESLANVWQSFAKMLGSLFGLGG